MTWHYPALMGLALLTGYLVSRKTQKPLGLSRGQRLGLALGAFCGGMLAAKLPFVMMDWEGFLSGRAWFDSGKTIMFGLVGGYFGVEVAKWSLHVRTKTGDSFAAPVAAAIAVGRLACFAGGCCYGTPTDLPWGVTFQVEGEAVRCHPTQLYEFLFHGCCACALLYLQARGAFRGQLVKLYLLAYLGYRFLTEFIRPEPRLGPLSIYQWAALLVAPVFVYLWWRDATTKSTPASAESVASPGG